MCMPTPPPAPTHLLLLRHVLCDSGRAPRLLSTLHIANAEAGLLPHLLLGIQLVPVGRGGAEGRPGYACLYARVHARRRLQCSPLHLLYFMVLVYCLPLLRLLPALVLWLCGGGREGLFASPNANATAAAPLIVPTGVNAAHQPVLHLSLLRRFSTPGLLLTLKLCVAGLDRCLALRHIAPVQYAGPGLAKQLRHQKVVCEAASGFDSVSFCCLAETKWQCVSLNR